MNRKQMGKSWDYKNSAPICSITGVVYWLEMCFSKRYLEITGTLLESTHFILI